ncbi:MAG: type II toxin-antitoxin system prevent-host-death family antitoxin [Gemmatimonadaceae bacterium]|nr:type II toxin-antitoxin system prevent-host-death family antitoxin [Gemmatimonadaceae bacterium]
MNVHEAKTNFSKLLARVALGEEIVLAKAGVPVAKLVPYTPVLVARIGGRWKGTIEIAADFDAPVPSLTEAFYAPTPGDPLVSQS